VRNEGRRYLHSSSHFMTPHQIWEDETAGALLRVGEKNSAQWVLMGTLKDRERKRETALKT
jgi:hypothetical protein